MIEKTPDVMVQKSQAKRSGEFLRASINHPDLKLDFSSKDATKCLTEIRRIMECLHQENDSVEDFTSFELSTMLSEEFMNNDDAMKEIRSLITKEQQYRVEKELLNAVEEIDLNIGKKSLRINAQTIKDGVNCLVADIDLPLIRHALVHVKGLLSEQERLVIIDRVHEKMPHAKIKAYQSEQDIEGKVLLEAMFFGDFVCQE